MATIEAANRAMTKAVPERSPWLEHSHKAKDWFCAPELRKPLLNSSPFPGNFPDFSQGWAPFTPMIGRLMARAIDE
ncbi:hypothetical protein NVV94_11220 [Pseudomonas sp. LS1212]|uniref:hypothetical protein n=1 Tax=Pseudomonas sp. LS1212 TaxID=2972478 RepID=UPI00215C303D|nr:hypothetical protein [Pseudomonas sp. LS1212]UVJ46700.1 hypothetical protein NVV94_11220 [Pseudomonas sp. LS1212]